MFDRRRLRQDGFGIVEAMVISAIFSVLIIAIAELASWQGRNIRDIRSHSSRDFLNNLLTNLVLDPVNFDAAASYAGSNSAGNVAFNYCYNGTPASAACAPTCCVNVTAAAPQPFNLPDPSDLTGSTLMAGTDASAANAVTSASPAYYTAGMDHCAAYSPQCPIEVVARYAADCGGGATSCVRANTISVTYEIRQTRDPATLTPIPLTTGAGFKTMTKTFFDISPDRRWRVPTSLAVGASSACAVVSGGIQCWGKNDKGQLGLNSTTNSSTPVRIPSLISGAQDVAIGIDHACAIVSGGVQCWGRNDKGQLGNGTTTDSKIPVQVTGLSGVTAIAVGGYHSCALTSGNVWCWGSDGYGQLGDGNTGTSSSVPVQVKYDTGVGFLTGVLAISTGQHFTCAVVDGQAKCWGLNQYGELGSNQPPMSSRTYPTPVAGLATDVQGISISKYFTVCAIVNGGAQCWGLNDSGQVGDGTTTNRSAPVPVTGLSQDVQAIVAAYQHTCALVNGGIQCWGDNTNGQLGTGGGSTTTPASVLGVTGALEIDAGLTETCALIWNSVFCWGLNANGELGDGTTAAKSYANPVGMWM